MIVATTQTELEDALASGGEIRVDGNPVIELTRPLQVTRPVRVVGGEFIAPSGLPAFEITSGNVEMVNLQIGGVGNTFAPDQKLIFARGSSSRMLDNINIHGCKLTGSQADNIRLEWCTNTNLSNNIIKRFRYSGVMLISSEGVVVNGNNISDSALEWGNGNCYGIAMTDLDNTAESRSRNITVTGNRVHAIDWEGIDTHGGDAILVSGNTVTACPRGIAFVVGNNTRKMAATNGVISGNQVHAVGCRKSPRTGIWLAGIPYVPSHSVITGNNVTGYSQPLFVDYYDRSKTVITGNSFPF